MKIENPTGLTQAQFHQYQRDGFLILDTLFEKDELDESAPQRVIAQLDRQTVETTIAARDHRIIPIRPANTTW